MVGHGVVSSYDGARVRVLSYDIPGHITPPLAVPAYTEPPPVDALVAYAEFSDNTGVILAIMEGEPNHE